MAFGLTQNLQLFNKEQIISLKKNNLVKNLLTLHPNTIFMTGNMDQMKADFLSGLGVEANTPEPKETPASEQTPVDTGVEPQEPVEPQAPISSESNDKGSESIDRLQLINETFGTNFASMDDVESFKGVLSELPVLQDAKQKYDEIKGQSVAKFHSKNIEEINNFALQTGIEDPAFVKQVKQFSLADKKDPVEALAMAEILKDPSLADKKDLLMKSIRREYKTSYNEDLYGDDLEEAQDRAQMEQFRLDRKAAEATKLISETMDKVQKAGPVLTVNDTIQQKQELKAQWANIVESNTDQIFGKVPVQVPKGKDKNGQDIFETIDYIELSPAEAKEQAQLVVNRLVNSGLEINQENLINAVSEQYDMIKAKNLYQIVGKVMQRAESATKLKLEKEISNPSALKVETPAAGKQQKTASDQILEKWEKLFK